MPWIQSKAKRTARGFPPRDGAPELARLQEPQSSSSWLEAFASTPLPGTGDALGSNNWVVDGTMTASGKPLLANDPHLGAQIPSLWYLAHLSAGDFDVIGATLPGTPAIAIGRNRYIAWGETNVMGDVQDLFREHLDPTAARHRKHHGQRRRARHRQRPGFETRTSDLGRDQRQQRGVHTGAAPRSPRTACVQMDGARS
jgi:acyl-homoserine lactone acylase PvdQ